MKLAISYALAQSTKLSVVREQSSARKRAERPHTVLPPHAAPCVSLLSACAPPPSPPSQRVRSTRSAWWTLCWRPRSCQSRWRRRATSTSAAATLPSSSARSSCKRAPSTCSAGEPLATIKEVWEVAGRAEDDGQICRPLLARGARLQRAGHARVLLARARHLPDALHQVRCGVERGPGTWQCSAPAAQPVGSRRVPLSGWQGGGVPGAAGARGAAQ